MTLSDKIEKLILGIGAASVIGTTLLFSYYEADNKHKIEELYSYFKPQSFLILPSVEDISRDFKLNLNSYVSNRYNNLPYEKAKSLAWNDLNRTIDNVVRNKHTGAQSVKPFGLSMILVLAAIANNWKKRRDADMGYKNGKAKEPEFFTSSPIIDPQQYLR